ncbi:hypothetical protein CNECB9_3820002 [Cupriavidus necator]|uniref:Uncharacterized protein n=1 Tax=Cupriavidus necator TaxID=106590 RepID=A0A1K0IIY1_CUPNE|nr:hypothetical protein CNECB9_3820002 [Cupriavidus necator]
MMLPPKNRTCEFPRIRLKPLKVNESIKYRLYSDSAVVMDLNMTTGMHQHSIS